MKRMRKKPLPVMLVVLLLMPALFLSAYAQEQNYDHFKPFDVAVLNPLRCQHAFTTTIDSEYRYISETYHGCYEVEIQSCMKCGFTIKEDVCLLHTEKHELGVIEGYEEDDNGEFIYFGICKDCNARVHTFP